MKVRLKCENPGQIEYTVTITATAEEWEKLRDQLKSEWPSWELTTQINNLLAQARKIYWPRDDAA